jgi:hypothetical protein
MLKSATFELRYVYGTPRVTNQILRKEGRKEWKELDFEFFLIFGLLIHQNVHLFIHSLKKNKKINKWKELKIKKFTCSNWQQY